MTVGSWNRPNYLTQTGTAYPLAIDGDLAVAERMVASFSPAPAVPADMTVTLTAGALFVAGTLVEVAAQSVSIGAAPASNSRIDRIVVDETTGVASVIVGTVAARPTAPAVAAGKYPVARVIVAAGTTAIAATMIDDERVPFVGQANIRANSLTPARLTLGDWTTVASASTVNLGAKNSRNIVITGSVDITSFGTAGPADNVPYLVRFTGSPTLRVGANMVLPSGADLPVLPGDTMLVVHDSASVWRVFGLLPAAGLPKTVVPDGHLFGLDLSYITTTSFGVAAGRATNENAGTRVSMALSTALTKGLGAWSAGTAGGSLDTGSIAANTWYHVHLIADANGNNVDVLLSLSPTSPTMPSGFTARRRIGSLKTTGSVLAPFVQIKNEVAWVTPLADIAINPIPTTATLYQLTVPTGVRVRANVTAQMIAAVTNNIGVLLSCPDLPDVTPGNAGSPPSGPFNVGGIINISSPMTGLSVLTDTSGRIRVRASATNSNPLYVFTLGYIDDRGA